MSIAKTRAFGSIAEEHVEQHALLLLEGAGERDAVAEALDHRGDELLGGELLGAGGESGDVVVGGGRHRGSDGTSADGSVHNCY